MYSAVRGLLIRVKVINRGLVIKKKVCTGHRDDFLLYMYVDSFPSNVEVRETTYKKKYGILKVMCLWHRLLIGYFNYVLGHLELIILIFNVQKWTN